MTGLVPKDRAIPRGCWPAPVVAGRLLSAFLCGLLLTVAQSAVAADPAGLEPQVCTEQPPEGPVERGVQEVSSEAAPDEAGEARAPGEGSSAVELGPSELAPGSRATPRAVTPCAAVDAPGERASESVQTQPSEPAHLAEARERRRLARRERLAKQRAELNRNRDVQAVKAQGAGPSVRSAAAKKRGREKVRHRAKKRRAVTLPSRPPAPRSTPPLPEPRDHRSALQRQIYAQWGWGADKDKQVRVPLPDWQSWERIRLWNVDHLTAFRYTRDHHAITSVFTVKTADARPTSQDCMLAFEEQGMPLLRRHRVTLAPIRTLDRGWREQRVVVHQTEGRVPFLFTRYDFSAAWIAYPAYEGGCLIYATVVLWEGEPELARLVLARFVEQGTAQVHPLTTTIPFRH